MKTVWIWGLAFLLPISAFASGKFQVKPSYHFNSAKIGWQTGISVYEKIPLTPLVYNMWTGGGLQPRVGESGAVYMVSEHKVGMAANKPGDVGVFGGYAFRWASRQTESLLSESTVFMQLEWKLW